MSTAIIKNTIAARPVPEAFIRGRARSERETIKRVEGEFLEEK